MNESEETEVKTYPSTTTCCKGSRPCPTVSQYQLDAPVMQDPTSPNYPLLFLQDLINLGFNDVNPCGSFCHLPDKGRKEIEEIVEEMKRRDREERGTGMKRRNRRKKYNPPLPLNLLQG